MQFHVGIGIDKGNTKNGHKGNNIIIGDRQSMLAQMLRILSICFSNNLYSKTMKDLIGRTEQMTSLLVPQYRPIHTATSVQNTAVLLAVRWRLLRKQ